MKHRLNYKILLALIIFFIFSSYSFAANRADIKNANLDNPTSIFFINESYFDLNVEFSNATNISESNFIFHTLGFRTLLSNSRFAMQISLSNSLSNNTTQTLNPELISSYDLKIGIALGKKNLSLGALWNLNGNRLKTFDNSSINTSNSFSKFIEFFFTAHNDNALNEYNSKFSLFLTYTDFDIFTISIFDDKFFSLNSQSIQLSASEIINSIGTSFCIRTPEYDSKHLLQTFNISFFFTIENIFSDTSSAEVYIATKLNLSGRSSILLGNKVIYSNIEKSEDIFDFDYHEISLSFSINKIIMKMLLEFPSALYKGDEKYFITTLYFNMKLN